MNASTAEARRKRAIIEIFSRILDRDLDRIKRQQLRDLESYLYNAVHEAEDDYSKQLEKRILDFFD